MDGKEIISAFRQHGFGNCSSIGVIKAAIDIWGITQVFEQNGPVIKLKDGNSVELSPDDLAYAKGHCGFQQLGDGATKRDITQFASLCFAVICKRKQMFENYASYAEAVTDINDGESVHEAPRYLGLSKHVDYISYNACFSTSGVVAHTIRHTVFVTHGVYDDYGEPNQLAGVVEWARFSRKMYRFAP